VSARSVLTKGSEVCLWKIKRDSFCSHFHRSAVRHRSRARSAQAKSSLRVVSLSTKFRDCCRKECVQGFSERFRVGKSSEGIEVFEVIEGRQRVQVP
jgi:hypothetical protein